MKRRDLLSTALMTPLALTAVKSHTAAEEGRQGAATPKSDRSDRAAMNSRPPSVKIQRREADLGDVAATGPLQELLNKSYTRLAGGPDGFGADWDGPTFPGDGRGRWMLTQCLYRAYLRESPGKISDEIPRMLRMRNPAGFFGAETPVDQIQAVALWGNSLAIQWGIDYTKYFGDPVGLEFSKGLADSLFVPRTAYLIPYGNTPGSHWIGEEGHSGIGLPGILGIARLALATGDERYIQCARKFADLLVGITNLDKFHGHSVSLATIGLLFVYELTGERRYLEGAIQKAEVLRTFQRPNMAFRRWLDFSMPYTEGCGVSDWLYLNLKLGRTTDQASYFDRAERILWGPFFHHMRPTGGMGEDGVLDDMLQLDPNYYDSFWCCTIWAAHGLVRVFTYSVLTDDDRLTLPLYYPFTATAKLKNSKVVRFAMETSYPDDGAVRIRILRCEATEPWSLRLRVPAWSEMTEFTVNGAPQHGSLQNGWFTVNRAWKAGDVVSFNIPLRVWMSKPDSEVALPVGQQAGEDSAGAEEVRIFRGPLLLAIDKIRNGHLDWSKKARFNLVLSTNADGSASPAKAPMGAEIAPGFTFPNAHLEVAVEEDSTQGAGKRTTQAILTPIAEAPGRQGSSPDELRQRILENREAIIFDVGRSRSTQKGDNS